MISVATNAVQRVAGNEAWTLPTAYGMAAAVAFAGGWLAGGLILIVFKQMLRRDVTGVGFVYVALVLGTVIIWSGLDGGLLARESSADRQLLGQGVIATLLSAPGLALTSPAHAGSKPGLPGPLGALLGTRQWLNTQPLEPKDLRGKVVVVNFWTYTCINSLRALPYVRAWAKKYKDRGLVVIGVHSPEFTFEKKVDNVRVMSASLGVNYPIAIDSDHRIWRAFNSEGWPGFFFIGADGRISDVAYGEGGYDKRERLIQKLLSEANGMPVTDRIEAFIGEGVQAAPDVEDLRSPETYVGYDKARHFVSPVSLHSGMHPLPVNMWSAAGDWMVDDEYGVLNGTSGSITYRFHARDLNFVMAPPSSAQSIRFRVKLDGVPPGPNRGVDVDAEGWGTLQEERMYQLIRQSGPVVDRTFEIKFFGAGVRAYVFTFG